MENIGSLQQKMVLVAEGRQRSRAAVSRQSLHLRASGYFFPGGYSDIDKRGSHVHIHTDVCIHIYIYVYMCV